MDDRKRDNRLTYSAILFLLCVILLQNGCGPRFDTFKKVVIPEQRGILIDTIIKHDTIFRTDTVFVDKFKKVIVNHDAENKILKRKLSDLVDQQKKDSIIHIFEEKTSLKRFNGVVNNDFINIKYNGLVEGNLKGIEFDYLIKQREIEVEIPKVKNRLFLGGTTNYSTKSDKLSLGIETGLITNKNVIKIGYNSDQVLSFGIAKVF